MLGMYDCCLCGVGFIGFLCCILVWRCVWLLFGEVGF